MFTLQSINHLPLNEQIVEMLLYKLKWHSNYGTWPADVTNEDYDRWEKQIIRELGSKEAFLQLTLDLFENLQFLIGELHDCALNKRNLKEYFEKNVKK